MGAAPWVLRTCAGPLQEQQCSALLNPLSGPEAARTLSKNVFTSLEYTSFYEAEHFPRQVSTSHLLCTTGRSPLLHILLAVILASMQRETMICILVTFAQMMQSQLSRSFWTLFLVPSPVSLPGQLVRGGSLGFKSPREQSYFRDYC